MQKRDIQRNEEKKQCNRREEKPRNCEKRKCDKKG